jgi:hypothetical protein
MPTATRHRQRLESAIVDDLQRYFRLLKKDGHQIWWFKVHGGARQKAGSPDPCVVWYGRSVWLEVKRPGETPTRLQWQRIDEIREAGGVADVVESVPQAAAVLEAARPQLLLATTPGVVP